MATIEANVPHMWTMTPMRGCNVIGVGSVLRNGGQSVLLPSKQFAGVSRIFVRSVQKMKKKILLEPMCVYRPRQIRRHPRPPQSHFMALDPYPTTLHLPQNPWCGVSLWDVVPLVDCRCRGRARFVFDRPKGLVKIYPNLFSPHGLCAFIPVHLVPPHLQQGQEEEGQGRG